MKFRKISVPRVYTGIGSRETPSHVLQTMRDVASFLGTRNWILRSGGAAGADTAFEEGSDWARGVKEIFVPWEGFATITGPPGMRYQYVLGDRWADVQARKIAQSLLPHWTKLKPSHKKLHARNVMQVLGHDLYSPSEVVVCWTPGGEAKGGTRTAIMLAKKRKIPVINMGSPFYKMDPACHSENVAKLVDFLEYKGWED